MAHFEFDSFVTKFRQLWHAGFDATLKFDTNAGQAWVSLQAGLGHHPPLPHPSRPHPFHRRRGPAQQRRRERRDAARRTAEAEAARAAEEATQADEGNEDPAPGATPAGEAETPMNDTAEVAEEASTENVVNRDIETAAAEATQDNSCDLCDLELNSVSELRTHKRRMHKASAGSPIPQLDGESENVGNSITYTFVSEFALEDINYTLREIFPHMEMNLLSRVKMIGPWSADHLCTLEINHPVLENFSWPEMSRVQVEVIKDIQKQ